MSSSNTNQPILCIPGVFANIKEERIRRVFGDLDLGEVTRIDIIVPKTPIDAGGKENKFNRVFIHINWNNSEQSVTCRERLAQGKDVKIIYDEPWFWRVSAYRPPAPKPRFESQSKPRAFQPKKATIQFDFQPEIKYSGIVAPNLTSIVAPNLTSMVASGLSIQLPVQNTNQAVSVPLEPKSPTTPPPAHLVRVQQQQDEFGEPIKQETIDYGNMPAPQRKKKIIIETDSK
jgi:hypothetical protein